MKKQLAIVGITILLLSVGLSGCVQRKTPVSEGNVIFSIEDVIVTSELEVTTQEWVNLSLVNATKTEVLNDSEVVIISVLIENKEDRILEVAEFWNEGLTDDKGNRYYHRMFIEVNDTTYSIEDITSIEEEEVFGGDILGMSEDFPPNSTNLRKIVYEIPPERVPEKLILTYGFKDHELTDAEDWFDIELQLPS